MTGSETSVWQTLTGHCWTDCADSRLQVYLGYAAQDPYAVHVMVTTPVTRTSVCVVIGRDLLADGLEKPTGDGEVRVASLTPVRLCITLYEVAGGLWLILDSGQVRQFLAETVELVPSGDEMCRSDLDAELRVLTDPQ
jgi:hypothetical protein